MTPQEALKSLKTHLQYCSYDEELDTITQALDDYEELKDSFEALEKKCRMYDYWRENCMKNDKILEIIVKKEVNMTAIKNVETLDSYNRLLLNAFTKTSAKRRYLTQEEYELLKGWLGK